MPVVDDCPLTARIKKEPSKIWKPDSEMCLLLKQINVPITNWLAKEILVSKYSSWINAYTRSTNRTD